MSLRRAFPLGTALLFALFAGACFAAAAARTDAHGDPLPPGALLRLGTVRWRACARYLLFTPDGKTLITGEMNGPQVIRFWDAATGKETGAYRPASSVSALDLSPDGQTMALDLAWESKGIVFIRIPDGKELGRIEDTSTYFHRLCYSSDGKLLAGVGNDGVVRVWDAATGKEILREQEEGDGRSAHVAFSPDGKRLAVGRPPRTLRLLEVATGKELFHQEPKQGEVTRFTAVGFSPDGKKLFWAGEDPHSFALRDASTGEPLLSFRVAEGTVRAVAISSDGKRIASLDSLGDGPPTIGLWDATTGKELRKLAPFGADGWIADPVFSPDGKRLASAGDYDGLLHVWDVETGKDLAQTGEHQAIVCSVGFSPNGRTVLTGCADKVIRVWDADKGTVTRRINVAGVKGNSLDYRIVFSNDRKSAAATNFQHNAEIWDLDSGKKRADLDGGEDKAWYAAFAPDGKTLASRGAPKGLSLWDAATGKLARRIGADSNYFGEFAFSPDGKTLIALHPHPGEATEMSLWDVGSGKELGHWPTQITWGGFGLQFSPEGRRIAVIVAHTVDLWAPAGQRETASLLVPKDAPAPGFLGCLAYSPDGKTLAAGCSSGPIYLWEVNTTKVRAVLTGHRDRVMSLDFSPDGSRLISGSDDTTALIWDLTGLADEKDAKTLTPERLAALWDELADADAGKAWRAGWRLAADPADSVPFLQKHLRPAQVDAKQVAAWLAALDGDDFEGREKATRELAELGDRAGPAVRQALEGKPSPEARRRLEELARKLDRPIEDAEEARAVRCVEALEHIGSADARKLLEELSRGALGARRTREAAAALERLSKAAP